MQGITRNNQIAKIELLNFALGNQDAPTEIRDTPKVILNTPKVINIINPLNILLKLWHWN